MKLIPVLTLFTLLCFAGCIEDYDIADVAPEEYQDQEHHHDNGDTSEECGEEPEETGEELQNAGHSSPSGHNHAAGVRNHGTQWFFNQPWAAPFIWSKLVRDGVIFLVLAGMIFFITGRKRR
jgi:hypothetical protein